MAVMEPERHKPHEYKWIRTWGRHMGSFSYYIEDQQKLAARDGAPLDAIYKDGFGTWKTIDDILNDTTRQRLGLPALEQ
jgi:hypothetical protein